jgi:uncharacterized protein (TIGR02145 family)
MKTRNSIPFVSLVVLAGIFLLMYTSCKKKSDETSTPAPNETGTVADIDGNVYKTVKIGSQWWMAENLKVTHYRNGGIIPNITDGVQWIQCQTGALCYYDNDRSLFEPTYGALYNWQVITNIWSIAPAGWHVPTYAEWTTLIDFLGGTDVAGGKMKEAGTVHWGSPNTGADNSSGLTILPNGVRDQFPNYYYLFNRGYLWSSTAINQITAWSVFLGSQNMNVFSEKTDMSIITGMSIRCVKNATK